MLSQVGKEVLIKAMAQSIPCYLMSVFKLLLKLCHELNSFVGGKILQRRMGFTDYREKNFVNLKLKEGWVFNHWKALVKLY